MNHVLPNNATVYVGFLKHVAVELCRVGAICES